MIYDMIEQSHDRLLGNNEIKFRPTAPSLQDKDLESIPLSIEQDRFYRENRPRERHFHSCVAHLQFQTLSARRVRILAGGVAEIPGDPGAV